MKQKAGRKSSSLTIILLLLLSVFNHAISTNEAVIEKQKGINYPSWAANELLSVESGISLENIRSTGANWISLVVTQYQDNIHSTSIHPAPHTATDDAIIHAIQQAKSLGFKVMLKPHVDLLNDPSRWRAEIGTSFSSQEWEDWFASYRKMILHYAVLAEDLGVDQFSVGTELEKSSPHAGQWRAIVAEIRQVFSGSLTYSANHSGEEFFLSWWDAVDYIGIDAYYPLSVRNSPTLTELELAWQQVVMALRGLYTTWGKPILFTELGYRSAEGASQRPYAWGDNNPLNLREQALLYQAFFNQVYWQPWFAGVYWWEWQPNPYTSGECDTDYTPFGKPAEDVIRKGYGGLPKLQLPRPEPDLDNAFRIFDDQLQFGWKDTSWAHVEDDPIGPGLDDSFIRTFSTENMLHISAKPGSAFAISIEDEPFDISEYRWLELLIHSETPINPWYLRLVDADLNSPRTLPINNCRYIQQEQKGSQTWTRILMPLDILVGDKSTHLNSIILSHVSPKARELWVDRIQLIPAR
jgi:hypothetical protein